MTEQRTPALLLSKVPYQERHLMLTLLCRDLGTVSAKATGAQGSVRRFGASLDFFVVFTAFLKKRRETDKLYTLTRAEPVRQFSKLLCSLDRSIAGQWLLKVAFRVAPDIPTSHDAFDALVQGFETLENCSESQVYAAVVSAVASFLRACDFPVSFERCVVCGQEVTDTLDWFFTEHGGLLCSRCVTGLASGIQVSVPALKMFSSQKLGAREAAGLVSAMVSALASAPFSVTSF